MKLTGVVLAAGGSTRMGSPKALLDLDGQPLILHHVSALESVCDEVIVVLGARAAEHREALGGRGRVVLNPSWESTGPRESLLLALRELEPQGRVVVTPVDAPPAEQSLLEALVRSRPPAVAGHRGEPGHPILATVAAAVRGLSEGRTLRDVLRAAAIVEAGHDGVLRNLNTPEDWRCFRDRLSS